VTYLLLHSFIHCLSTESSAAVHLLAHANGGGPFLACNSSWHLMRAAAAVQDGKMLPGTKGLSMSEDQWSQLVNNMAVINQALGN
jgi:hypothetical protein